MASRDLDHLHPATRERFDALAAEYARRFAPWFLKVTCVHRSHEEQEALYAQGRKDLDTVNAMRRAVGMCPITEEDNVKVTWTLASLHTTEPYSYAVDVVPAMDPDGDGPLKVIVDYGNVGRFRPLIALCEKYGLVSGGTFKTPDHPHIQAIDPTRPGE